MAFYFDAKIESVRLHDLIIRFQRIDRNESKSVVNIPILLEAKKLYISHFPEEILGFLKIISGLFTMIFV